MRNTQHRTWNMTRKTEKREKWEMQTVGPEYGEITEKLGKGYTNTVWHRIWPETKKKKKNENLKKKIYELDYFYQN